MASSNNSGVHYPPPPPPHSCKECGIFMNSAESLEVHLQYHKENLLNKWATQAATSAEESNNNTPKIKREFAAADSSDGPKKSPEYSNRATPDGIFGHPPTPQSYQSAASPYQSHEPAFSPNYHNYQQQQPVVKQEAYFDNNGQQFFMEQYGQEFPVHKAPAAYRYHPYQQPAHYERPGAVSSSSPAYPPQPTPSPSPKQCDKCGYVCDSAAQLVEHLNLAHPPAFQHFLFGQDGPPPAIKAEDNNDQSEILDLDSHKVHQVYPEEEKHQRQNGDHSVSALLNPWSPNNPKMYQAGFMQPTAGEFSEAYRPFEHLPPQPATPVISSTQVATPPAAAAPPTPGTKAANWKSNEARRPKTYNCTACNKWFTSSGHLKRHYNTTLHKNAVKSSGQPDPASLPISAHHHPARDPHPKEEASSSPGDDDTNSMPGGIIQQPPSGPYDRQQHPLSPNLTNGSPPNGEAGLSPTSLDSRGLLNQHHLQQQQQHHHQQNIHGFMPMMDNSQFQMYPNGSAPHVTQDTATTTTSNLSITGEYQQAVENNDQQQENHQPLPSFAQFQRYSAGLLGYVNVGGGGLATAPYTYYQESFEAAVEPKTILYRADDDQDYRLTVLTVADPAHEDAPYSPPNHNNNNSEPMVEAPEKAHIKRDYEENTGSPLISSTVQNTANKLGVHKCIDCDKLFNKACYLTQHNKTFHSGDKPFKCTRCGKRFSSDMAYQEHLSKHAGEKPHKCDLCPKQFNHKTDLRRHMCLHTGNKPYSCDTCGKGFIRKDHMLKHCETHFRKSQNKMTAMR